MNLTKEEAKDFFAETYPKLADSWDRAWRLHMEQLTHPYLLPSCRAHILQNLAFGFAQEALCSGDTQIFRMNVSNQQLLRFGDRVIVGFKKLTDEGFAPHSYPTTRVKMYYRQESLPGIGATPRLVCGLKLTPDWTEVVGIYLVHPKNHHDHNWVLNLSTGCTDIDLNQNRFDFEDDEQFFTAPAPRIQTGEAEG